MSRRAVLLVAVGAAVGIAAQRTAFDIGSPRRWIPDLAVGWTLIVCGLVGSSRRPASRTGGLLAATGFAWFLGNFATAELAPLAWLGAQAMYLHRGLLVHAVLSFPTGRLPSRAAQTTTALGYGTALVVPLARDPLVTLVLAALLVASVLQGHRDLRGPARRARGVAVGAAAAVAAALAGGALIRLSLPSGVADEAALLAYSAVLCGVAAGLLAHLLRSRSGAVANLVVELTQRPAGSLRDQLAQALGDPTLQLGYRASGTGGYVDAHGHPFEVPSESTNRSITWIESEGQVLGVLVHDPAVLSDPQLLSSISSAARLAAAHARLQAEVQGQIREMEASRQRLLEAAGRERRRLRQRLRETAERRLQGVAATLDSARQLPGPDGDVTASIDRAVRQAHCALEDVRELGRGLHPPALERLGLPAALEELVGYAPVPVDLQVTVGELSQEVAAAAYFVCSEGLANLAKHSRASRGQVTVTAVGPRLRLEIVDDGVGGADLVTGFGLRGLADRVKSLGGRLSVQSPKGAGTRLVAELPLQ